MTTYTTHPAEGGIVYVLAHDGSGEPGVTVCVCPGPDGQEMAERIARLLTADEAEIQAALRFEKQIGE